jgi:hypothetical protein
VVGVFLAIGFVFGYLFNDPGGIIGGCIGMVVAILLFAVMLLKGWLRTG